MLRRVSAPVSLVVVVVVLLVHVVVTLASSSSSSSSSANCASTHSHAIVSSGRNASGDWLITVQLQQRGSRGGNSGLAVLHVEPTTSRCDGVRTDALIVRLQGPPAPPSPGFEHLPGFNYYKIHEESVSWEEAKSICEVEDAHLLILNSEAEAAAVHLLVKRHPKLNTWVHIGFHDKIKEGQYVTIFGQTLAEAGFTRWNGGQPDNAGNNENCGSLWASTMGLNDLPCTTWKTHFICEQNAF